MSKMHADHVVVEFCLSLALAGASVTVWASPPLHAAGDDVFAGSARLNENDRRADIRRALHARDERHLHVEGAQLIERRQLSAEERRALRLELDAAARDAYGRQRATRAGLLERERLAGD